MDDKYIKDIYDNLGGESVFGNYNDYYSLITSDDSYIKDVYDSKGESVFGSYDDFVSLVKKKDDSVVSTSQEGVTESTTKEEKTPTSLESSDVKVDTPTLEEEAFDYDSFIDKDEDDAIVQLQKELTGKGYSVQPTGVGDALNVTDNITGQETEIDLQPINFLGGDSDVEIDKVKSIIQTKSDVKREILSKNQRETFDRDPVEFIQGIENSFRGIIDVEYIDNENVKLTKDGVSNTFKIKDETSFIGQMVGIPSETIEGDTFFEINKFLYNNMNDKDAEIVSKRIDIDNFKLVEEGIKNIDTTIDVSVESAQEDLFDKNYFDKLLPYLKSRGIEITDEINDELKKVQFQKGSFPYDLRKEFYDKAISNYLGENMDVIDLFNKSQTVSLRKEKIERAKKLKTEVFYENLPNREAVKESIRALSKDADDQEVRIKTNIEMAKNDFIKLIDSVPQQIDDIASKYPDVKFERYGDSDGAFDIITSEPVPEIIQLKARIRAASKAYVELDQKSQDELKRLNSKSSTSDKFMDAANRNYEFLDIASAEVKNALIQMGGGASIISGLVKGGVQDVVEYVTGYESPINTGDMEVALSREGMTESREKVEKFFETKRTYDEALKEGSFGSFGGREFAIQFPNIALAIATSGAGSAVGLGEGAVSSLIATQFGVTSAGQKYDEVTTRQEQAVIAKKALDELEEIKDFIPEEEYFDMKYNLERASADLDISPLDKTLSVIGTGLVEGVVTKNFGTVPNSIKVIKDLKPRGVQFVDDILKSNYKAASQALKEMGKRTGGEIIEETSIDLFTQINDYAFLGDQIDLSSLDDVAITSIITSGGMNVPSTAYSTILSQVKVGRFKNKIKEFTKEISSLKEQLKNNDLTAIQRNAIHSVINKAVSNIANETTNMEADAMLLGADNIKDLLTFSGLRNTLLKKANVESNDSYDIVRAKIDNYLDTLSDADAKKYKDNLKDIDNRVNNIIGGINYEGAIDKVFGEKGTKIAEGLDKTLTPQQKYVEVYKQVRQEIQDNALKEFNDAIQAQQTSKPAKDVQEGAITPEESSNYANLTEDAEGNFVFFHIGDRGYDTIERNSGKTSATSKEEAAALSKVGGLAMYYTGPKDSETQVSGDTKYAVKVPASKVYDFNTDPLGFIEEARARHKKENPNSAFDPNSQVAYVTKIAGENGFEMVVAQWAGKTRAQTTKEFKPNDTQELKGNEITKPFSEEYTSNLDLGFESIIPETKDEKFRALYDKINNERNLQQKYDDLYSLREDYTKKSQDEITELIEGSDLSQEIKDEYKEILEFKEEKRRSVDRKNDSVFTDKTEMPNAPKGVFLDIEMVSGKEGRKMSEQEVLDALPFDTVEVDNDGKNLRIKIPRELSSKEMMSLMKATEQEAIGQVVDGMGVLYAQNEEFRKDYGDKFNPDFFKLPREGKLKEVNKAIANDVSKLREMFKAPSQRKQVDNALNALSKIAPDVEVILHESEQAYAEATGETGRKQKTGGTYDETIVDGKVKKVIHINPEEANARTVAHESFHAIFLNMVKTDAEAQRLSAAMIKAVYKSAPAELKKLIDNFAESKNADGSNNYDSAVQNEEKLSELIGYLATEYPSLPKPTKNVIKRWLDRLAKMFGMKPFTDSEVIDVLNTIAGKVARGEVISDKDISIINKREISNRTEGMSRNQLQDLFLSDNKVKLKSTKDVAKYLDAWTKENAVFEDDVKNISDREIVDRFVDHLTLELHAWEKVRKDDYISFYDDDVVKNTNPTLQQYAKNEYGRELTDTEVKLYHLVSSFASPSANPEMDSWKGFDIFDRWMKTGELSGYSDKIATVWKTLPGGKRVDTGVPRLDDKGKPARSKVTPAYSQTGLDKFNTLIEKMGGDIDKAMEWITSQHSYSEISDMFGYPEKGPKSMKQNEYMTKDGGGLGVFGMTGAKLGSYILNRFGNFSTVTKDMWYARTMARLSGQDLISVNKKTGKEGAIKTPWSESTKEGRRMRSLADEAFKKVADLFDTSPAMVQERIWDFEKRLYEMLGANEDAAYTSDGLKKGIDRAKDSTTPSKEPTTRSRKQIIGENADLTALNLSYSLNLAKEIESFLKLTPEQIEKGALKNVPIDIMFLKNKTPEELKYMTGWERGKDNKWRYEIPDGKLTLRESGTFKLSDVYDSKDLYKAYPQLKDMKVEVDIRPQGRVNAWFTPDDKSIEINAKPDSNVTSLLVHEIQHAIQFIEGFAIGGNMMTAFEAYESTVTPEEKQAELDLKEEVEVLRNLSVVLEMAMIDFEGMSLDEVLDLDFMRENLDELGLEEEVDAVNIYEYVNVDNPQIINKLKKDDFGYSLDLEGSFEEASFIAGEKQAEYSDKYSTYALYQRLAGEVESRNVEKRYRMSEEKRRKTLLEATENVAREDQILLFPEEPTTRSRKQKVSINPSDIAPAPRSRKQKTTADGQVFTFGMDNYNIDKADSIIKTEDVRLIDIPINILPKLSFAFVQKTEKGINNADTNVPVILATTKNGLLLIDGHHRVEKAIRDSVPIEAYVLNTEQTSSVLEEPTTRSRKQAPGRPSIEEIVRKGKENMISDAAIRQFAKEEGYTDAEITAAMNIPSSEEIVERSEKAIRDRLKKKDFKGTMRYLRKKIFDRQTYIKDVLKGVGNKKSVRAHNRLVTKAGAKGFANYRFTKAEKEIYSKLSEKEKKQLDALIYARRIVAINENRKKRDEKEYIGAGGYNYDKAKSEVEAFSNDKLSKRADKYFEVFNQNLKRLRDSGRISEDVYISLRDIEYSPIKTIKYIIGDNHSTSEMNNLANSIGVSQKDIMALSDENINDLITDSRWLLMMNISAVENRAATNEVLNLFYDAIESADADGLAAIGDNILDNPIIGNKESGAPKFKYDDAKVPVGYRTVSFFKDGVEHKMVMREEYARQLLDIKVDDKTLKALRKFTFGNVLRFFATSGNPLFIVGNTAVDFQNILFLGDTYSKFKLVGGVELGFDFVNNSLKKMFNTGSYQKTYEEFMTYGGGMDFLSVDGIKAIKGISRFNKPKTLLQKGMVKWGEGLSYLGETSEMAFRLAVYEKTRSKLINQYKKDNKKEPTGQDLEDILYESARESRETIDFSQGGDLVKSADYVLPYLNASVQGARRAVDYASKNPGGFASSMIQYAVMSGGLLASSLYMLSSAFDDEDDEEEKAKKMKDAWGSVSDYEKSAYHIIFTGDVDEDGEYEYYRFKKLPVVGSLSTIVEESIISTYLKSKGVDYEFNTESVSKALDKTSPIGITDIGSRNPVISGVLSYVYNKDTFTGEDIFRGPRGKKILPEAEGILDNKVEQIYKDIAPALGMSPKRTQVMVEKVITNERTNPLVGVMYGGYNGVFSKETTVGEEMKETMNGVLKSFSGKIKRSTNSKLQEYKKMDEVKKVEAEMETEIYIKEQKVYNAIKEKRKNKQDIDNGFLRDIVKDNFDKKDWKKYGRKFSTYAKNANIDRSILDLIYEDTPEVQAYKIFSRYGDALDADEKEELKNAIRSARRNLNKKALSIYNKEYRKK